MDHPSVLEQDGSDLWLYEGSLNRQNLRSLDREKSFWADGADGHFQSGRLGAGRKEGRKEGIYPGVQLDCSGNISFRCLLRKERE